MSHSLTADALLDLSAQSGSLLLAPSAQAAAALGRAWSERQQAAGHTAWSPLRIFSWSQWLASLWTDLLIDGHEARLLLNPAQERSLWSEIIAADPAIAGLAPTESLATLAQSAWALAAAHSATSQLKPAANSPDARAFARWADTFTRRCTASGYLSAALLESALTEHIDSGHSVAPAGLILCGFAEHTPARTALLASLQRNGAAIDTIQLIPEPSQASTHASTVLPDRDSEARFALRLLREIVERSTANAANQPSAHVALIVPDLAAELPRLEPLLREVLAPELNDVDRDASATPWHTSTTAPLATSPRTSALLDLMRWVRGPLQLDQVRSILLSPVFSAPENRAARARFDADVLGDLVLLRPEIDLHTCRKLARNRGFRELAAWLERIEQAAPLQPTPTARRSFADWSEQLRQLCAAALAPAQTETALDHALAEAFDAVLDLTATLDFSGRRVTFAEACDAVEREAARVQCPSLSAGAVVHLLTPEQALGQTFAAAIFLRSTDTNLPAATHPHPLLEWSLQRRLGMPGCNAAAHTAAAQANLTTLAAAASSIVFTTAAEDENGALRPSALPALLGFPNVPAASLLLGEALPAEAVTLHSVPDSAGLPPLPEAEISGGSRLLKLQAACGFLAFAELRLGGREHQRQDAGFDALESGSTLHRALESFWKEVRTQKELRSLSQPHLEAELHEAIARAVTAAFAIHPPPANAWDAAYLDVQQERLRRLLRQWLQLELERGDFTVLDSERKEIIAVGPLRLSVRLDRIDQVHDEEGTPGVVFVDYKSGRGATPAAWRGARPDEPQLPLYALLGDPEELRGIAFARVRANTEMQWAGIASQPAILPRKGSRIEDLVTLTSEWRSTLTQLAEDFFDGRANVQPKNYPITCTHCGHRLLCRLDVNTLLPSARTEEDDEAGHE
jgi:probable DNA repair protein